MKPNKQAFTLIELLVVVLIIGILAAVAMPQYQLAVMKSRYATLKHLTRSIADAQRVYYLANGKYATHFEQLDISLPGGKLDTSTSYKYNYPWGYCDTGSSSSDISAVWMGCSNLQIKMRYQLYLNPDAALCFIHSAAAPTTLLLQARICKQETSASPNSNASMGITVYTYK